MQDWISRTEAINAIHTTMHKFFNTTEDPEPFNDKDNLLLNVNKAITNTIKELQPVQLQFPFVQVEQSDVPDINVGNINYILDKISNEIKYCRQDEEPHLCDYRYYINVGLDMALNILDNYKTEREE